MGIEMRGREIPPFEEAVRVTALGYNAGYHSKTLVSAFRALYGKEVTTKKQMP